MVRERFPKKDAFPPEYFVGWDAFGTPIEDTPKWDPQVRIFECDKHPGRYVLYEIDLRVHKPIAFLSVKCPHCHEVHQRINPISGDSITSFLEERGKGGTGK